MVAQLLPLTNFVPFSFLSGVLSPRALPASSMLIYVPVGFRGTRSTTSTENHFSPMRKTKVQGNDMGVVGGVSYEQDGLEDSVLSEGGICH